MVTVTPECTEAKTEITERDPSEIACIAFDIETRPIPDEQLRELMPEFVPPPEPGPFDESSVKTGNLKDPAKIQAKVDEARKAHEAAVKDFSANVERMRLAQFSDFRSKAALDSTTGEVAVVGLFRCLIGDDTDGGCRLIGQSRNGGDEERVLVGWWKLVGFCIENQIPMIGHNIHGFDLPFVVQRSWIRGVPITDGVLTGTGRRFWNPLFIDTMREWGFGNPQVRVKLDVLGNAFGLGGKEEGECCGANFHEFWFSEDDERRNKAMKYLVRDIKLPAQIAMMMGVV